MDIGPPELLIILAVVLVLFGGKKLPELARSLGKAKQEFQDGLDDKGVQKHASAVADAATPASPPTAPSPPVDDTGTAATPTTEG